MFSFTNCIGRGVSSQQLSTDLDNDYLGLKDVSFTDHVLEITAGFPGMELLAFVIETFRSLLLLGLRVNSIYVLREIEGEQL